MQAPLTWEADELRAGMRKIPGYAGHVTGVQYTIGRTYGTASAEALSDDTQTGCKARHSSAVLGHRHDGYTTQGNTTVIIAVGEVCGGVVLAPASWNAACRLLGSQPPSAQLVRCATTQAPRVAAASAAGLYTLACATFPARKARRAPMSAACRTLRSSNS
jgi:hypothetical protein